MVDQPTAVQAVTQLTFNRTATSLLKTTAPSTPEAVVEAKVDKVVLVDLVELAAKVGPAVLVAVVNTTKILSTTRIQTFIFVVEA